ncbi:MAG: NAD(P)H-hydrate dehydratase [Pseudomonadota bacterium]
MAELLTAAQMRAHEAAAMASGAVSGLELMERAGRGVVAAILATWPELGQGTRRARVLCGPGNNGGDGFVVARLLIEKGWQVEVYLSGDATRLSSDARANHDRLVGPVYDIAQLAASDARPPDLEVDALFGTGLTRPLAPAVAHYARAEDVPRRVAIDIPSGLCADSGRVLGDAVFRSDLTVTFHSAKPGHLLAQGPSACGKLIIHDIGLGPVAVSDSPGQRHDAPVATHVERASLPSLAKHQGHKFDHGHALVLSGGPGRTGAARLAARAALRVGAGLVTLGVPPAAQLEVAAQVTAVMLARVEAAETLKQLLTDARYTALCLGPGFGLSDEKADLTEAALKSGRWVVIDADALTLIEQRPALFAALHDRCILTPHGGEFARLFPDIATRLAAPVTTGPVYSKLDATREAATRCGATVLYKGADTVIAHPGGPAAVHAAAYGRAAPWLATAGAGDVLAGMIAGLLARGFDPMHAAQAAAWLHVECARSFGPGLIAEDLPEQLPVVLRTLGV